jgi:hypothetical protein
MCLYSAPAEAHGVHAGPVRAYSSLVHVARQVVWLQLAGVCTKLKALLAATKHVEHGLL